MFALLIFNVDIIALLEVYVLIKQQIGDNLVLNELFDLWKTIFLFLYM